MPFEPASPWSDPGYTRAGPPRNPDLVSIDPGVFAEQPPPATGMWGLIQRGIGSALTGEFMDPTGEIGAAGEEYVRGMAQSLVRDIRDLADHPENLIGAGNLGMARTPRGRPGDWLRAIPSQRDPGPGRARLDELVSGMTGWQRQAAEHVRRVYDDIGVPVRRARLSPDGTLYVETPQPSMPANRFNVVTVRIPTDGHVGAPLPREVGPNFFDMGSISGRDAFRGPDMQNWSDIVTRNVGGGLYANFDNIAAALRWRYSSGLVRQDQVPRGEGQRSKPEPAPAETPTPVADDASPPRFLAVLPPTQTQAPPDPDGIPNDDWRQPEMLERFFGGLGLPMVH
jgi:hypothetical protein